MTLLTSGSMDARAKDWRLGSVVYQIFVDRFAPPANLESKRSLYPRPRQLRLWSETPKPGTYLEKVGLVSHELEFWGGDFASLSSKMDYVQNLGADVVYLLPIHKALSNHKYDAQDYREIAPEYGTKQEFLALLKNIHRRGMKVMLDGVFNHMGRRSDLFQNAFNNPLSPYRDWFYFDKSYPLGYRAWAGAGNLPALRLETKAVRDYLWNASDSVVKQYLREGIDGWRLDVAFELGPTVLAEITRATHQEKPHGVVIGEISGYPSHWSPAVDGVFNFSALSIVREMLEGKIRGGRVGQMLAHMVQDAGIETLLRSWLLWDNHDTSRLANMIPERTLRHLGQGLQFTLPGSPVIYYGSELGMTGEGDPQNRAPMRWDWVNDKNPDLVWVRKLIALRKRLPALRYGDFTALDTERLLAFTRTTERLSEAVLVVVNPTSESLKEVFPTRIGRLMSWGEVEDVFSGQKIRSITGLLSLEVPPHTMRILIPSLMHTNGYSPYHRIP